jgi:hypothetical protein
MTLMKEVQRELGCASTDRLFPYHTEENIANYFS